MSYSISLGMLVMSICLSAQFVQADIRDDFHHNDLNKEQLVFMMGNENYDNSPITLAYKGLCQTMFAEYAFLPTSKLTSFNSGKEKVESAIAQHQGSCELRYIRLLIQLNTPRFLGYHDSISGDLEYFITNVNEQIDNKWKVIFVNNLLQGKHLEQKYREQLLSLKKQLS